MADVLPAAGRRVGLGFTIVLGAMPALVFGALAATDDLGWRAALCGGVLCVAVAAGFGRALDLDVAALSAMALGLRQNPEAAAAEPALWLPGMRVLAVETAALWRAERQRREALVAAANADRLLVERLPDPLLKLDAGGNILWRNTVAAAAFGRETAALLRHPDFRAALAETVTMDAPVRRSVVLAAPMPRDLDISVIPVAQSSFVLIADRTRERAVEKMRADFVANSSHELRTPLASLIGFIETLRGPAADDPEAQQRFLGIMAEQAQRMQRVIADLLSLSRIEMSEHQPPDGLLPLPPLLERIAAGMEPMLRAGGARLMLAVPADLPDIVADADQLAQLFTNLLDNAIKYGRRGGTIRLTAATAAGDTRFEPNGVLISVADEGAGIPREHIPRLTERFYRVDTGRSRAVGGTGLGLAIVKHVVNRHRGRLRIDSVEGQGTTFTVWLPAA